MKSDARTVAEYLESLPDDRRRTIESVREVVLRALLEGYAETMNWGMICYEIPLERYPTTYNKKPLMYAALASQKNYCALYLMCLYCHDGGESSFQEAFSAAGKQLNMGKSCVRFKSASDLPMDVIESAIASTSVDEFIADYERSRARG